MSATQTGGVTAELYVAVLQFLHREAALLDAGEFDAWLELLHDDVVYEMPMTLTRERSEAARVHDTAMEFFAENRSSLAMRIKRLHTEYAWAEDPPTRTRHMVSNAIVAPEPGSEGALRVEAAFAVHCNRGNLTGYDVFVGSPGNDTYLGDAGRDVLNRLEVLFRGPAGEVVVNP